MAAVNQRTASSVDFVGEEAARTSDSLALVLERQRQFLRRSGVSLLGNLIKCINKQFTH